MQNLATQLNNIIEYQLMRFNSISRTAFKVKPAPDKWSKQEILGHLIDSAQNNIQRFIRVQHENEAPNNNYQQDNWVQNNHYQSRDVKELISLWELLNKQIVHIWQNYPADKLKKPCHFGKEIVPIQEVIADYIRHTNHHLSKING